MRWESKENSSFGVGASAFTLGLRDENVSYYYYHEPSALEATSTSILRTTQPHGQLYGSLNAKKPPDKRKVTRGSLRPTRDLKPRLPIGPDVASAEPSSASIGCPAMIMCAGKSVYGSGSELESPDNCSNNNANLRDGGNSNTVLEHLLPSSDNDSISRTARSEAVRRIGTTKPKRVNDGCSLPRQRTDEELEQIIRDLRDQIFQQPNQQPGQHEKTAHVVSSKTSAADVDMYYVHHRKYLKNPVEKMEGVIASGPGASITSLSLPNSNGPILQRPLSSSQLCRLVTESTSNMVVPAIISTTARGSSFSSHITSLPSSSSTCSTSVSSRLRSSSSSRPVEKKSMRLGEVAILNPRHLRANRSLASTRIRDDKELPKNREHERCERHWEHRSDSSDNFLYLVDVEECLDVPESLSLSPVGPWIANDFGAVDLGTATPHSPSVSTCCSVSSFGDDNESDQVLNNKDLTTMSPRSRLLYFSACAFDEGLSRTTASQLRHFTPLRRSATCASGLAISMKFDGTDSRAASAKPVKRCSSAKSTRGKKRATSNSRSAMATIPRRKAAGRALQARKRPQSGGPLSSRSNQSESGSNNNN